MPEIRQRILENMQKFSRAMIGAVLFLPVIGLILALSSVLTNPTLIAETSFLHQLGQMLGDTFWPLFGNLGLLFCVGISYGLAKDKNRSRTGFSDVLYYVSWRQPLGWNTPMDSPKKLTVNIMAPGKPSCWALWWWIWAFSWHYSRLHDCVGAQ